MQEPKMRAVEQHGFDRRAFLGVLGASIGAGAVTLATKKKSFAAEGTEPADAALSGKVAILYNASKCVGCHYCEAACRNVNDLNCEVDLNVKVLAGTCIPNELFPANMLRMPAPDPVTSDDRTADRWLRVTETTVGSGEEKTQAFFRHACTHCGKCAQVCPAGALKRRDDGIVSMDPARCIGCKYCFQACPYNIPRFKEDGNDKTMRKCIMCFSRVDEGLQPACVTDCPAGALQFGPRETMLATAQATVDELQADGYADAQLFAEDTGMICVLPYQRNTYPAF